MSSSSALIIVASLLMLVSQGYCSPLSDSSDRSEIRAYCLKHQNQFQKYCSSSSELLNFSRLGKLCAAYKKHCQPGKVQLDDALDFESATSELVLPPSLPRTSDLMFDLPIGEEDKPRNILSSRSSQVAMDANIIASCTPDCTAPHCTLECKCANTHQNVYRQCNPPADATIAVSCVNWYQKCYMFKPLQY